MKQVCWHSRRSKAYRGLPEARGQSEAHGDSNHWGPLAMIDGVAVGHCGAFWTAKVLLFVKAAPVLAKKGHCRISFSEL